MAQLTAWRWERFVPNLGNNREVDKPFWFRIKSGLSKVQLAAFEKSMADIRTTPDADVTPELLASVFSGLVEFGDEPLVVDGAAVTTLDGYFGVMLGLTSYEPFIELGHSVVELNSLSGTRTLFYERLSGGLVSMRGQRVEKASATTAGR